ncbi:ATP-binding protein [Lysinibacillus antri]|uniref:ATP-binding protein n=2 Tax=Lysinibacillus antri TaxID=2498145 RepID=A0A432L6V5_9BACI|nr:ATP-binding protein [Lysinibacillus antri]
MRDNGYKNTAYAVAELIDNSIQANANYVQIMCKEQDILVNQKKIPRLTELAVLDNGDGMDAEVLQLCLQFGNGTRLERSKRTGIGRFGMGLPASSISQCTRVDVWSWQDGVENALHTYLDIKEVKEKKSAEIPLPTKKEIPSIWRKEGVIFQKAGTLIVWSDLDKFMWTKAQTLINHSELIIGRMYRKFLNDERIKIDFTTFNTSRPSDESIHRFALPNDPLYLMEKTSCPAPYNETPMFEPYMGTSGYETTFDVPFKDEVHQVFVRLAHAKDEARESDGASAGSKPHGKHASGNIGISILRAERELDMDTTLVNNYDPTERWWGIEVEFPPSLDELMGVSNNKQAARNFSDVLKMIDDMKKEKGKSRTFLDIKEEFEEEEDPRAPLLEICNHINKMLTHLRKIIVKQNVGSKATINQAKNEKVEKQATDVTNYRKEQGFISQSDEDEKKPTEQRKEEITESLVASGVDDESAKKVAQKTVTGNSKYNFIENSFEGSAFFTVRLSGGAINVIINKAHPAYENLLEVLNETVEETSVSQLKSRLDKASMGLKLLLAAWARYEDETPDGLRRDQVQEVREDWGKYAKQFLKF